MSANTSRGLASDQARGRKRGVLFLLLAAGLAAALVAGTALLPERAESAGITVGDVEEAQSGTAYCPVIGSDGDEATLEIASTSPDQDSQITITRFVDGAPQIDEPRLLEAGRSSVLEVPADQLDTPVVIDWLGAPVVAQYRLSDATERSVATCQTRPSDRWYLSGFDTNRGNTSTIFLFNPFESDAIVTLRFGTTDGPVDLIIADELLIPAGQVAVRDLAEFRPETADLAVTVEAQTGRVVPQGQIRRGPAGEGLEAITGRELLAAVPEASTELYIPEATVDSGTDSWVTIYNPGERAAAAQINVSTPLATAASVGEMTVPAGGTTRFELGEQSALPRMGVSIRSVNGVPLVASRTSAITEGDRTGLAITTAVPADVAWTVPGATPPNDVITVFNPGSEVATARLEVVGTAPPEWEQVSIPPNAVVALPVAAAAPEGPIRVSADQPVVVGVVSMAEGIATAFWSTSGSPARELLGPGQAAQALRDPALSSRPATSATATPAALPFTEDDGGEGQLDSIDGTPEPTFVPEPSVTPTFSPGPLPTDSPATPVEQESAPADQATAAPDAAPGDGAEDEATEEGSLFG